MSDEFKILRNTPILSRAMKCEIIPPVERLHVYPIRIYDGRPEEGGKLLREEIPICELPEGWEKKFNAAPPKMEKVGCVDCGGVFGRLRSTPSKIRCAACQKEKQREHARNHNAKRRAEMTAKKKCA